MNKEKEKETRAGKPAKALVRVEWRAGETSTSKLAKLGNTTENAVRGWIDDFEEVELAIVRQNQGLLCTVTEASIEAHKETAEGLESEIKRIWGKLAKLDPLTKKYQDGATLALKMEKRLSEMTGIDGMIKAHAAALIARSKIEEPKEEKEPDPQAPSGPRYVNGVLASGPVVPLDN